VTLLKASPATLRVAGRKLAVAIGDSELGRQIAIDLKADADFDERRSGPGHDCFLSLCHEVEVKHFARRSESLLPIVRIINARGQIGYLIRTQSPAFVCLALSDEQRTRKSFWLASIVGGANRWSAVELFVRRTNALKNLLANLGIVLCHLQDGRVFI
jgi:hypothetical protein